MKYFGQAESGIGYDNYHVIEGSPVYGRETIAYIENDSDEFSSEHVGIPIYNIAQAKQLCAALARVIAGESTEISEEEFANMKRDDEDDIGT